MAVTGIGSWLEAQQAWVIPKRGAKSLDYEFVVSSRCRRTGMATFFGCSCSESRGGRRSCVRTRAYGRRIIPVAL
jgi:hypothetical protein